MKRLIFAFVLILAGGGFVSASWIPRFNQDFIIKNVLPSTRGGIYPTDVPEFQRVMRKHGIIPLCRKYRVNLQMGRKSVVYRRYRIVGFKGNDAKHLRNFERYIISVKTVLRRYTPEFARRMRLTIYLVYDISHNVAGLACGREIVLGSSSSQTLHHEIGHIVNNTYPEINNIWKSNFWRNGRNPNRKTFVSSYARTNYREDFAETFGSLLDYTKGRRWQYIRAYPNLHPVVLRKLKVIQNFLGKKEPLYSSTYWRLIMGSGVQVALSYRAREASRLGRRTPGGTRDLKAYYTRILKDGIFAKDQVMVKQALENGANVNAVIYGYYNWTPLHYAAKYNLFSIARTLLDYGADSKKKDKYGRSPAKLAVSYGRSRIASLIRNKSGSNGTTGSGGRTGSTGTTVVRRNWNSSLLASAKKGSLSGVKAALTGGARINYHKGGGWTALLHAVNKKHASVVRYLVRKGANVNYRSSKGWTALLIAAWHGELETVKLLVKKGARKSTKTSYGANALAIAKKRGHNTIVRFLKSQSGGNSVRSRSWWNKELLSAARKGSLSRIRKALAKGADINISSSYGWTPLMMAVYYNKPAIVRYLLSKGADKKKSNKGGYTALKLARYYKRATLIGLLGGKVVKVNYNMRLLQAVYKNNYSAAVTALAGGAKANALARSSGWRAVHYASYFGNVKMIQLLVSKGASLTSRTVSGDTPLTLARKYKRTALVAWLETKLGLSGGNSGSDDGNDDNGGGYDDSSDGEGAGAE